MSDQHVPTISVPLRCNSLGIDLDLNIEATEATLGLSKMFYHSWGINPLDTVLVMRDPHTWVWVRTVSAGSHSAEEDIRAATKEEMDVLAALSLLNEKLSEISKDLCRRSLTQN